MAVNEMDLLTHQQQSQLLGDHEAYLRMTGCSKERQANSRAPVSEGGVKQWEFLSK